MTAEARKILSVIDCVYNGRSGVMKPIHYLLGSVSEERGEGDSSVTHSRLRRRRPWRGVGCRMERLSTDQGREMGRVKDGGRDSLLS